MSGALSGVELEAAVGRELGRFSAWARQHRSFLAVLLVLLAAYTLFANAWVSEDAYITLRSVEQVHAGNGPRWNPHERVQAYTHPLWFWLLCFARLAIPHSFFAALALGGLCTGAALLLLYRDVSRERGVVAAFLATLAFLSSKAIVDYSTSGLENPLSYLLLVIALIHGRRWFFEARRTADWVLAVGAIFLLATNRLDTLSLSLPLFLALAFARAKEASRLGTGALTLVCGLPVLASLGFSLLYYGMVFPNTAYAKVVYGVGPLTALGKGLRTLVVSGVFDPLAVVLVSCAVVAIRRWEPFWRAVGVGAVLNILYVVVVGGDFMAGRFLTLAAIAGLFVLAHRMRTKGAARLALALVVVAVFSPFHPFQPFADRHAGAPVLGVADERAFYSEHASLEACFVATFSSGECPDHPWYLAGKDFANSRERVRAARNVGFFGYRAGLDKIVVDELGLADPLLARMPSREGGSRSGHVLRVIPDGYLETLEAGENRLRDESLRRYYDVLGVLTRDPIFSEGRLRTIVDFQLGKYDDLIEGGR